MVLSLAQLLTPSTEEQSLESLISILDGLGFSASSWQSGSIQRTLVQLVARLHASASNTTLAITKGRFNDTATGDWLTLKSSSDFDNTRIAAVAASVRMTLSDPNSVGPITIAIGQLVARDQNGKTYRNVAGDTLPAGGSITMQFDAEITGYAPRATSMALTTPIAGIDAEIATVDPIVRLGQDAETDERLRTRNRSRWATLAYAAPQDAWVAWALAANPNVKRAWVDDLNPRGPGTLDIYVAGTDGVALPNSALQDVYEYLTGTADGIDRRPIAADLGAAYTDSIHNALLQTITITGTLYVLPAFDQTATRTAVYAAIDAVLDALPVGGTVKVATIYATIMAVTGVSNVHLTAPLADITVAQTSVPVSASTLTVQVG